MTYVADEYMCNVKCNYIHCKSGCGFAGRGICTRDGDPFDKNCDKFELDEGD